MSMNTLNVYIKRSATEHAALAEGRSWVNAKPTSPSSLNLTSVTGMHLRKNEHNKTISETNVWENIGRQTSQEQIGETQTVGQKQ